MIDEVKNDLNELKVIVAKQEANLSFLNTILAEMKDDVKTHIKRSDSLEGLYDEVKVEVARLREEHKLTKQLLLSKIEKEQIQSDNKSNRIWLILKTVFYTLSSVGAVLLALKELEILDKLFK